MVFKRPPTHLSIDVAVSVGEVLQRIESSMGMVRSFLLSPTSGRTEDFVGQLQGSEFKMRVRHGASNGLTRLFYGKVIPASFGSRVEGKFRTLRWVVLLLRAVWVAIWVPVGLYVLDQVRRARAGGEVDWSEFTVAFPLMLFMFVLFIGIEAFARRMGDRDEHRMREHLNRLFEDVRKP